MKLLACDPGGVHVGLASFQWEPGQRPVCTRAWETNPDGGVDFIAAGLLNYMFDTLVVEEFRLYPDKAMAQTGSTMPTCEMIGCIKWAHRLDSRRRQEGWQASALRRDVRDPRDQNQVLLAMQPAAIQEPTAGVLRRRQIKSLAKARRAEIRAAGGEGDHALSAELHGWHYFIRTLSALDSESRTE